MVPNHTSIAAPILLGIAGQIALKSAANGSATVIAQVLNPLMIIGLTILSSPPSATSWPLKRFQSQSPSPRASYAVVAVLAHILWNEPLGWPQMAGIVMIGGGVLLVRQH
jgi:hypothetical protein